MNKRRKKKSSGPTPERPKPPAGFYTPFRGLDQHLPHNISGNSEGSDKPSPASVDRTLFRKSTEEESDSSLFARAMDGVNPMCDRKGSKVPLRPPERKSPRFLEKEEMEAYAELVDLVAGEGPFELSYSDEYIDGAVVGISPEVLKKLREGHFSYQDHLDLHGLNRIQAREATNEFILANFAARKRCVLIIPGRGLNSKDKEPVLKNNLVSWLTRAPLKKVVLAFASARSYDGGWGAFYILLRQNEGKTPLVTPAQ